MEKESKKIWLKIEGKAVLRKNMVDASVFGNVLIGMQKIINSLSRIKYGRRYKLERFRLFVTEFSPGSVIATLESSSQADLMGAIPFNKVAEDYMNLTELLVNDPDEFKSDIEKKIPEPRERIKLLNNLKEIWSKEGKYKLSVNTEEERPEKFLTLKPEVSKHIENLVKEYEKIEEIKTEGIIIRIRGDDPNRYFVINTVSNTLIKCFYEPEMESEIREYFKQPVTIKGYPKKKAKTTIVEQINELKPFTRIELDKIGKFRLDEAIPFDISYDSVEETWQIKNDELVLHGEGKLFQEAIDDLEESLETLIVGFLAFPEDQISEKSKEIKSKISQYLDIERYRSYYSPVVA